MTKLPRLSFASLDITDVWSPRATELQSSADPAVTGYELRPGGPRLFARSGSLRDELTLDLISPMYTCVFAGYLIRNKSHPRLSRCSRYMKMLHTWSASLRSLGRRCCVFSAGSQTVSNVRASHLPPIVLPPVGGAASAIAAVLDAIDEAIECTEAVISATERLRDALLHELLTRGVPGWHTQWRTVPGLGSIPADWQVVRLKEILVLDQPGAWGDEPTLDDPGVCVLRAADLTRDGHVVPDGAARRRLSKRDRLRRLMRDGDLMLERSGGGPGTPVGRVALIDGLGPIYCNNFCQHLRVDASRCNPDYAVRVLWHRYLRGITGRLEHRTTGIRNLDYAGYLAFPLPLPSLDEQDTIAKVLDRADGMHVQARAERDRLRALKASVTVVLLTGRVRVGQEQLCGLAFQS